MISALTGLLVGGAVSYVTSRAQLRIQAEHEYDRSLRDLRLPHYQRLFHLTESVPRQWLSSSPDRAGLRATRQAFQSWYFGEEAGGLFLSQAARDAYFALQNALQAAADGLPEDTATVTDRDSVIVRAKASALRHQLSADLGVAQQPRRPWITPRSVPAP
ncbi:hypothetical protein SAMN05421812_101536 [Asanoa hainanensis]|uniref:Uncharacterized protein n=2 Tax=Asanoa hainanensis TaxID=560556 RepID=A0A239GRW4_9ACTN|nr:hypothetical protein SAMN05421812_101536 [Asanoa hainanensis]